MVTSARQYGLLFLPSSTWGYEFVSVTADKSFGRRPTAFAVSVLDGFIPNSNNGTKSLYL